MELMNHLQKAVNRIQTGVQQCQSKDAKRNCQDSRRQGIYTQKGQIKVQPVGSLMTSLTPQCYEGGSFGHSQLNRRILSLALLARLALLEVGAFQAVGGDDVKPQIERRQEQKAWPPITPSRSGLGGAGVDSGAFCWQGGRMRGCRSLEMDSYCIQYLAFWPFSTPDWFEA